MARQPRETFDKTRLLSTNSRGFAVMNSQTTSVTIPIDGSRTQTGKSNVSHFHLNSKFTFYTNKAPFYVSDCIPSGEMLRCCVAAGVCLQRVV